MTATNGPYLVTNVPAVRTPLGERLPLPPQLATVPVRRLGDQAILRRDARQVNGFTGAKDPNRVPDQRDTYPGQQVTIFDNRGICQHSGLCTDRLPAAFRTDAEPFVAPSGGRMDEIVRAVRDCPSGALSLAFDGEEARDLADWHGEREPAIEITQDGPYRVTGAIPLAGAARADAPRAAGSSASTTRCAGAAIRRTSRSAAACTGTSSSAIRPAASEPTLFEWAGGLPALTRLTRLLYEKQVPADDLLAPLFATMAPGYPQREAAVLAAAFGGPAAPPGNKGPPARPHRGAASPLGHAGHPGRGRSGPARRPRIPRRPRVLPRMEFPGLPSTDRRTPLLGLGPGRAARHPPRPAPPATRRRRSPCPDPMSAVSFAANIKPLFREHDRKSMAFAFDLWSQADVQAHAAGILERLRTARCPATAPGRPRKSRCSGAGRNPASSPRRVHAFPG